MILVEEDTSRGTQYPTLSSYFLAVLPENTQELDRCRIYLKSLTKLSQFSNVLCQMFASFAHAEPGTYLACVDRV